jgi:hypothetical protein
MACPKCDYKYLERYPYEDANGKHILWIMPVEISEYVIQNEHVNYCPNCGMELPTKDEPAQEEGKWAEPYNPWTDEYDPCG